mmetsp:Transcript_9609/g.21080  ORF Transcript_9609/g.21080 Transcript_9609/m.21080 type:complete len:1016 (-) Transcript_9609:283-3330(-)
MKGTPSLPALPSHRHANDASPFGVAQSPSLPTLASPPITRTSRSSPPLAGRVRSHATGSQKPHAGQSSPLRHLKPAKTTSREQPVGGFRSQAIDLEVSMALAHEDPLWSSSLPLPSDEKLDECFGVLQVAYESVPRPLQPVLTRAIAHLRSAIYDTAAVGGGRQAASASLVPYFAKIEQARAYAVSLEDEIGKRKKSEKRLLAEQRLLASEYARLERRWHTASEARTLEATEAVDAAVARAVEAAEWQRAHNERLTKELDRLQYQLMDRIIETDEESVPMSKYEALEARNAELLKKIKGIEAGYLEREEALSSCEQEVKAEMAQIEAVHARMAEMERCWTPRPPWALIEESARQALRKSPVTCELVPGLRAEGNKSRQNLKAVLRALEALWEERDVLSETVANEGALHACRGVGEGVPPFLRHAGPLRNGWLSLGEVQACVSASWRRWCLQRRDGADAAQASVSLGRCLADHAASTITAPTDFTSQPAAATITTIAAIGASVNTSPNATASASTTSRARTASKSDSKALRSGGMSATASATGSAVGGTAPAGLVTNKDGRLQLANAQVAAKVYDVVEGCKRFAPVDPELTLFLAALRSDAGCAEWQRLQSLLCALRSQLREKHGAAPESACAASELRAALHTVYPTLPTAQLDDCVSRVEKDVSLLQPPVPSTSSRGKPHTRKARKGSARAARARGDSDEKRARAQGGGGDGGCGDDGGGKGGGGDGDDTGHRSGDGGNDGGTDGGGVGESAGESGGDRTVEHRSVHDDTERGGDDATDVRILSEGESFGADASGGGETGADRGDGGGDGGGDIGGDGSGDGGVKTERPYVNGAIDDDDAAARFIPFNQLLAEDESGVIGRDGCHFVKAVREAFALEPSEFIRMLQSLLQSGDGRVSDSVGLSAARAAVRAVDPARSEQAVESLISACFSRQAAAAGDHTSNSSRPTSASPDAHLTESASREMASGLRLSTFLWKLREARPRWQSSARPELLEAMHAWASHSGGDGPASRSQAKQ